MRCAALAALLAAVCAVAALGGGRGAGAVTMRQINAQLRESGRCGCAVCPCVVANPVRTIQGLEKLSAAKAQAALPLGWRPVVDASCPCPVPSPCRQSPCEPAPCPCRHPGFYFANLVDELADTDACGCAASAGPCPCRKPGIKPELTSSPVLGGVECVGPGPCLEPRKYKEPEYTHKLRTERPVSRVVPRGALPGGLGDGIVSAGSAEPVTDEQATAEFRDGRAADEASGVGSPAKRALDVSGSESSGSASQSSAGGIADDSGDLFFSDSTPLDSEPPSGGQDSSAPSAPSGSVSGPPEAVNPAQAT